MHYASRLSDTERSHLAALRGRELAAVRTDGWAAELTARQGTLRVEPEAMRTPDREHPIAAVARPRIVACLRPTASERLREIARDLGPIVRVTVQRTVVTFSPPRKVYRSRLAGVTLPAGIEYGALFRRPGAAVPDAESVAVVDLDIGLAIDTAAHRILLYTNGTGPFINVCIDGRPSPGWEERPGPLAETAAAELEVGVTP